MPGGEDGEDGEDGVPGAEGGWLCSWRKLSVLKRGILMTWRTFRGSLVGTGTVDTVQTEMLREVAQETAWGDQRLTAGVPWSHLLHGAPGVFQLALPLPLLPVAPPVCAQARTPVSARECFCVLSCASVASLLMVSVGRWERGPRGQVDGQK